jgi:hypothetical protein
VLTVPASVTYSSLMKPSHPSFDLFYNTRMTHLKSPLCPLLFNGIIQSSAHQSQSKICSSAFKYPFCTHTCTLPYVINLAPYTLWSKPASLPLPRGWPPGCKATRRPCWNTAGGQSSPRWGASASLRPRLCVLTLGLTNSPAVKTACSAHMVLAVASKFRRYDLPICRYDINIVYLGTHSTKAFAACGARALGPKP